MSSERYFMLMLILRFAHVFFGALWVGMFAFMTFFLMPAFGEAGPEGAKLMAALVAFLVGMILGRPIMMRSAKLGESLQTASAEQRATMMAEMGQLRPRGAVLNRVVMGLLLLALGAMAVARYL